MGGGGASDGLTIPGTTLTRRAFSSFPLPSDEHLVFVDSELYWITDCPFELVLTARRGTASCNIYEILIATELELEFIPYENATDYASQERPGFALLSSGCGLTFSINGRNIPPAVG